MFRAQRHTIMNMFAWLSMFFLRKQDNCEGNIWRREREEIWTRRYPVAELNASSSLELKAELTMPAPCVFVCTIVILFRLRWSVEHSIMLDWSHKPQWSLVIRGVKYNCTQARQWTTTDYRLCMSYIGCAWKQAQQAKSRVTSPNHAICERN